MATPLQYQPQFVQANLGVLQRNLQAREQEYAATEARQQAMEDNYAALQVDTSDIGLKNELLGGYQKQAQDIVSRYGGDYGAAKKDLSRLATNMTNDQGMALMQRKRQLSEEQRKLENQFGPNAITTQNVRDINLRDADGNYIGSDQLDYNVYDSRMIDQHMKTGYGALAQQRRKGDFSVDKNFPALLRADINLGLNQQEVSEYTQTIADDIRSQFPGLSEEQIQTRAANFANQLDRGYDYTQIENKDYTNSLKNTGTGLFGAPSVRSHAAPSTGATAKKFAKKQKRNLDFLNKFNELVGSSESFNPDSFNTPGTTGTTYGSAFSRPDVSKEAADRDDAGRLDRFIKDNDIRNSRTYNEIRDGGGSDTEAIKQWVVDEGVYDSKFNSLLSLDGSDAIYKTIDQDLILQGRGNTEVEVSVGGSDDTDMETLSDAKSMIIGDPVVAFNQSSGELMFAGRNKDGEDVSFMVPSENLSQASFRPLKQSTEAIEIHKEAPIAGYSRQEAEANAPTEYTSVGFTADGRELRVVPYRENGERRTLEYISNPDGTFMLIGEGNDGLSGLITSNVSNFGEITGKRSKYNELNINK